MLFVRYRLGWGGNFDDNAWMPVSQDRFPDGTLHMTAPKDSLFKDSDVDIHWKYDNDAELFSLICLRKHYADCKNVTLYMPYCPHARMDRVKGKTDEDNLGFTYDELDNFLLQGHYPSYDVYKNIEERHKRNLHKINPMPSCPRYS